MRLSELPDVLIVAVDTNVYTLQGVLIMTQLVFVRTLNVEHL